MKILVTGGLGFKGSVLIPKLLENGHSVVNMDINWFGNYLKDHQNYRLIEKSILNIEENDLEGVDAVIHLASVANDPSGDLNPELTWETSTLGTMLLAEACKLKGIDNFTYASSGSVYGIQESPEVTEDLELKPISGYNKTKMIAERVLLSYKELNVKILRPATVCGLSPRMRLDVAVNLLTHQAVEFGKITVMGGEQTRPNVHIDDITDLYVRIVENPEKYSGIYNVGFENLSINEIAQLVARETNAEIVVKESNDPRSYKINSDKILNSGFEPKKNVGVAISEMINAFFSGELKNREEWHTTKWMKKRGLGK